MAIPMHYETSYAWSGEDNKGTLSIKGLPDIHLGGARDEGLLDPEHMLLGATEACHFNTFMAIAKNSKVEVLGYSSTSTGDLSFTKGEGYQFERIVVKPVITVPEAHLERAKRVLEKAHNACLISRSICCGCDMEAEWIAE